jgi:hypothetical protein
MSEKDNGGPRDRQATNQGTPKESSPSLEMKVSQMNTPISGTRRKLFLLECEENADGEISYCRRIPIYDEYRPLPGASRARNAQESVPSPLRREQPKGGGCTIHLSDVPLNMRGRLGRRSAPESDEKEGSKKD